VARLGAGGNGDRFESNQFYEQIIQSAQEGVIVFDGELRYVVWNPFMEQFMGVSARDVIGKRTIDVFPQLAEVGILDAQTRALAGESLVLPDVLVMSPHSQQRYWFSVHYSPLRSPSRQIVGVICIVRDITERKGVEEQLRQAQKMEAVGRLAAGIAHDFNNLLTAINGFTAIALGSLDAVSGIRAPLLEVLKAGERAAGLTRQLLAHSRKQVVAPRVWDLNTIVAELDTILRRLLGEDVELVSMLGPAPQLVRVDRSQVEQVILNLAVNARDAMPGGGRVRIETGTVHLNEAIVHMHGRVAPGAHVVLTVGDTGTGIPQDVLRNIFEPFFTTKGLGKGTGLGLSTVYGVVQQSGGNVLVETEQVLGATFRVYFPLAAPTPTEEAAARLQASRSLRGRETILVVEDESLVREFTAHILKDMGYQVHTACNGRDALQILDHTASNVDLVVTDSVMPDIGGRELERSIRARSSKLPVLHMSGYDPTTVSEGTIPEDYLQKPFTPSELLDKVRNLLDRSATPE
jgi:PAS domain S-box-containing protein